MKRLEKAGWIRSVPAEDQTRRPRVVYEITAHGLKVLKEHLSRPVTSEDIIWRMDDLMLGFAFMEGIVGRERTVRFLQDFASRIDAHVADLRRYFDGVQDIMPTSGRLAMENGIQSYETNAQWARRAIQELQH